jgi:uncharacterized membrane protein YdbT with pleckstrin-like domain
LLPMTNSIAYIERTLRDNTLDTRNKIDLIERQLKGVETTVQTFQNERSFRKESLTKTQVLVAITSGVLGVTVIVCGAIYTTLQFLISAASAS